VVAFAVGAACAAVAFAPVFTGAGLAPTVMDVAVLDVAVLAVAVRAVAVLAVAFAAFAADAVAVFATAAALAVAALAVAAPAVAAFAVAAPAVAAFAVAAFAVAAFAVADVARDVRAAGVAPRGFAFPWRCAGTAVAFCWVDPAAVREVFPEFFEGVDPLPGVGWDPSSRRRSWWSELMHLTSVGQHCECPRGEEREPCKHVVTVS
jgi:hypothetical protein